MKDDGHAQSANRIEIYLKDEELAALEGWRAANQLPNHAAAARQLIQLGLLSEIGKIYRDTVPQDETP